MGAGSRCSLFGVGGSSPALGCTGSCMKGQGWGVSKSSSLPGLPRSHPQPLCVARTLCTPRGQTTTLSGGRRPLAGLLAPFIGQRADTSVDAGELCIAHGVNVSFAPFLLQSILLSASIKREGDSPTASPHSSDDIHHSDRYQVREPGGHRRAPSHLNRPLGWWGRGMAVSGASGMQASPLGCSADQVPRDGSVLWASFWLASHTCGAVARCLIASTSPAPFSTALEAKKCWAVVPASPTPTLDVPLAS